MIRIPCSLSAKSYSKRATVSMGTFEIFILILFYDEIGKDKTLYNDAHIVD